MSDFRECPESRLEVFKMWFEKKELEGDDLEKYHLRHRSIEPSDHHTPEEVEWIRSHWGMDNQFRVPREKHPGQFKGRIFIFDGNHMYEIYNSKIKEDGKGSFFTELPANNDKNHLKRKWEGEEEDDSKITPLPVMGFNGDFCLMGSFYVVVHRDSGDALLEDKYVSLAIPRYRHFMPPRADDWIYRSTTNFSRLDQPFLLQVDGESHSLVLECVIFSDAKMVHVEVKWVDNNYMDYVNGATDHHDADATSSSSSSMNMMICGELSVISDNRKSILFKTPPNKASMVSHGKPIPLLKSVVVVPYHSDFKFMAHLGRPNNVVVSEENSSLYFPTVNGSVDFPNAKINDYEDCPFPNINFAEGGYEGCPDGKSLNFDEAGRRFRFLRPFRPPHSPIWKQCKNRINGDGGYIEVTCTIDNS